MSLLELFLICLKASMLSSGGLAALPLLQDDLTRQRPLLTDSDFASAVAISRITPGPNGLFVLSIGYYLAGFAGSIVAGLGISVPAFLAIGLIHVHRRLARQPWILGVTRGITASAIGTLTAVGYSFAVPLVGSPGSLAIFFGALAILLATKTDALPVLALGCVAGVLLTLAGVPLAG